MVCAVWVAVPRNRLRLRGVGSCSAEPTTSCAHSGYGAVMTHAQGAPVQLAAAMRTVSMQVDRENVLQARAAILAEAEELKQMMRAQRGQAGVGLCGSDPLSPRAADAFNSRIGRLYELCYRYAAELELAANALDDVARRYGLTEEQIETSFASISG
jgi:hypothetical protein